MLRIHEEMYRQRREGMIAVDRWKTTERSLAGVMTSPGYQACFSALRGSLDKEFAELIDEMIETSPAAASYDLAAEWREGVRTQSAAGRKRKHDAQRANGAELCTLRRPRSVRKLRTSEPVIPAQAGRLPGIGIKSNVLAHLVG